MVNFALYPRHLLPWGYELHSSCKATKGAHGCTLIEMLHLCSFSDPRKGGQMKIFNFYPSTHENGFALS